MRRVALAVLLVCAGAGVAAAHKPSDSHVRIVVDGDDVSGSIGVAVRDLDGALDLDGNGDGEVTWTEATAASPRIATYLGERFELTGDGARCELALATAALVDWTDGAYWTVPFTAACAGTGTFALTYRILFDVDVLHRGLVQVVTAGGKQTIIVRDATPIAIDLPGNARPGFLGTVREGAWFAWTSLPYLLVLACLVLPLVFVSRTRRVGADEPREVALDAARTFGAFAAGSAVSLSLAAGGVIDLPDRWIDLAIALSGVAVAVINLCRVVEARWDMSLELGLLHGLGTALALRELDVEHRAGALLGFGLGTVLGGALVVAALVPALFVIRRTLAYQAILWGGSGLVGVVAMVWTYRFL
jgi:hypothetical protein